MKQLMLFTIAVPSQIYISVDLRLLCCGHFRRIFQIDIPVPEKADTQLETSEFTETLFYLQHSTSFVK